MQCQVRSMAEASAAAGMQEEPVQEGRVGQVCREWLVREDGVLAYKLQHEEINQHYDGNRFRNRVARTDRVEAKTLQEIEEEEAEMVRQTYERMLLEQEERDAEIARHLQEQLLLEDKKKHQSTEEEDQRLALQLQERERLLLERKKKERELERERKQVQQVHAMHLGDGEPESDPNGARSLDLLKDTGDIDLTDFLLEPPDGLTEEELRKFREHQDAELARLLQEQETKRRGSHARDRQMAIEAQDMELARVLQEQEKARLEKAKLKRAREKSRLKALQQQQLDMGQTDETEIKGRTRQRGDVDSSNRSTDGSESDLVESTRGNGVANVAMMLDPTYKGHRRNSKDSLERPGSHHSLGSNGGPSQGSSSVENSNTPSPIKSPSTQSTGSSPLLETLRQDYLDQLEDDNDPVPPYMPIQGQRRMASLEKTKKKKSRDSCKTQ